MRVTSPGMFRLACSVSEGVFSTERLIRFTDAAGDEYSALVDESLVHESGDASWVEVARAESRGDVSLVALPTDGTRVWVRADELQPAT